MGHIGEAVLHYSKALDVFPEQAESPATISILVNLGVALNYGSLYREAIPCLIRARNLCAGNRDLVAHEAAALCNLAQSHLYLDHCEKAFHAIVASLALSSEPSDSAAAFQRAVREFTFVQIALELGELALARQHAGDCARYANIAGTERAKFLAQISGGLLEIHGGVVGRGLRQLEDTLDTDLSASGGMFRSVALVALVKGYEEAGQAEQALRYMNELMKFAKTSRENGLLVLKSIPRPHAESDFLSNEIGDLAPLGFREARLRAKVAERKAEAANLEMLERLAVTADLREDASGEHGYRVGELAALIAQELGWLSDQCNAIKLAARLHDIGKIGVPDRILLNTEQLKEAERNFIGTHTKIGAEILSSSSIPHLRIAEAIARYHHEWWNGDGYPSGLAGKRIPVHARIVAVADVFDALTHGRSFSPAWPLARALEEIKGRRGTQFDPHLTDVFLNLIGRLQSEHPDLDAFLARESKNSPFLQARNRIRQMVESHESASSTELTASKHEH
jgi:putative two-component system response regulator